MAIYGDRPTAVSLVTMATGLLLTEVTGSGAFLVLFFGGRAAGAICVILLTIKRPEPTQDPFVLFGFLAFFIIMLTAMVLHERNGTGIRKITIGST